MKLYFIRVSHVTNRKCKERAKRRGVFNNTHAFTRRSLDIGFLYFILLNLLSYYYTFVIYFLSKF